MCVRACDSAVNDVRTGSILLRRSEGGRRNRQRFAIFRPRYLYERALVGGHDATLRAHWRPLVRSNSDPQPWDSDGF